MSGWSSPRRLGVAAGAVVVVLLVLLFALGLGDDDEPSPQTTSTSLGPATSGRTGSTASEVRLPEPAKVVEGDVSGARVRLEVQPLARTGSVTVLTSVLTVLRAPDSGALTIGDAFAGRGEDSSRRYALSDVRLFLPSPGLLASPATSAEGEAATSSLDNAPSLKEGESAGLRVAFGTLPPDAQRADVLWPLLGVIADLPVQNQPPPALPAFGRAEARDVALPGAVGQVRPVTARSSELEGAVRTEQAPAQTRVVLAADVLFALDSADLSPQANAALDRAAAAIQAAGPGPVKVTGHTDDQGTDQYNLDLSNRRARSVAAALASRLPPDRFPPQVAGRGEAEPAVKGTSEEARAANRRVELLVERGQRAVPAPAPTALPPGGGPSAPASQGLLIDQSDGSQVRLRAERAVRQGSWLRLDMTLTVERSDEDGKTDFLVDLRDSTRRELRADASGVGVLDGSVLRLPAVDPDKVCACANTLFGLSIVGKEQRKWSAWVAAGSQTDGDVVVQLPRAQGRLTGVPVQT